MHYASGLNPLLEPRACASCPQQAPTCNCSSGFECVLTAQTCDACSAAQCVAPTKSSSGGFGTGAVAGAVVGVLIFLFFVVGGFLWWRRRAGRRRQAALSREKASSTNPPHSSAGMTTPFSRSPGLVEKGPSAPEDANPFEGSGSGAASVASGSLSAHSIPIGLAPDSGPSSPTRLSPTSPTFTVTGAPVRPARPQDLNIRNGASPFESGRAANTGLLEPPRPNYAPSTRSGLTVSTMDSTASSAMEGLYESPTIVSAVQRTVIGAGRAEAVPVNGLGTPNSPRILSGATSAPLRRSQPGPSPLSSTHFAGRLETLEEDPFADGDSIRTQSTNMSFGMGTPAASIRSVQASTANRVTISSLARSATLRSLGAKSLANTPSISEEGQLAKNQRGSEVSMGYPPTRRTSMESVASNPDSVLASFPFVPPSPLPTSSSRSPLSVVFTPGERNRQSNASSLSRLGSAPEDVTAAPPLPTHDLSAYRDSGLSLSSNSTLPGPSRPFATSPMEQRASTMSAASEGLGDFDFQFGSAPSASGHGFDERTSLMGPGAPVSQPQLRSDSMALPASERIALSNSAKNSPKQGPASGQPKPRAGGVLDDGASSRSYASLDVFALSRDLQDNRLPYE